MWSLFSEPTVSNKRLGRSQNLYGLTKTVKHLVPSGKRRLWAPPDVFSFLAPVPSVSQLPHPFPLEGGGGWGSKASVLRAYATGTENPLLPSNTAFPFSPFCRENEDPGQAWDWNGGIWASLAVLTSVHGFSPSCPLHYLAPHTPMENPPSNRLTLIHHSPQTANYTKKKKNNVHVDTICNMQIYI